MNISASHCRLTALSVVVLVAGCATPGDGTLWGCAAKDLVSARYDGSESAHIQLAGYTSGTIYKVTLNDARTEATGTAGNGAPFKCIKGKMAS